MEVAQIRVEDGTFQKCTVNKYLSLQTFKRIYLKLSKKNFRGILRAKSVRRILVIGLIYGPRANTEQFDMVFWSWPGSMGHSDSLIFKHR